MNILNKLTLKNLKLNKKRTISTIIGIILSCALICAVATMVTSFQATLVENAVNDTGYYHVNISNIDDEDIVTLKNNRDIENIFTINEIGYGNLQNSQNEYKQYLKLFSMDLETFENLKFDLVEGRFPTDSNEVIISKHIINNAKVEYKIGDKINIDIGTRISTDGYELNGGVLYSKEEEKIIETQKFEFTIVGIIERPDYDFENRSDPGYTIISTNINKRGKKYIYSTKKSKRIPNSNCEYNGNK